MILRIIQKLSSLYEKLQVLEKLDNVLIEVYYG